MTTMVERVARAIQAAESDNGRWSFDALAAEEQETYRAMARAAIAAMDYEDGTDEESAIKAAAVEKIDVVSFICSYQHYVRAALIG